MADQTSEPVPAPSDDPLPPNIRRRIQTMFGHGQKKFQEGECDYAHDMFSQCVAKDPGNLVYVEAMFDNLIKKFDKNKKGGRQKGNRGAFKKAVAAEDWPKVWTLGLELLKHHPWDVPALRALAEACEKHKFNEVELRYLKGALDADGKDIEVNRHCATSLTRMGQFDQAIACWHRIEDRVPDAAAKISELTLAKNRPAVGIDLDDENRNADKTPSTTRAVKEETAPSSSSPDPPAAPTTMEELRIAIAEDPTEVSHYKALAKLQDAAGKYLEAETSLQRALSVAGGDLNVRELLESAQIRRKQAQLEVAKQRAATENTEEAKELEQRIKEELNRLELEIYDARAQRYPDDLAIKHELATRLKRAGNHAEAEKYYEAVQSDDQRGPAATLNRGECLQHMRQYLDALKCYVRAAKSAENQQPEVEKLALYRAGVLAIGLKDAGKARDYLSKLVAKDPGYRDAQTRLDKLSEMSDT